MFTVRRPEPTVKRPTAGHASHWPSTPDIDGCIWMLGPDIAGPRRRRAGGRRRAKTPAGANGRN